MADKDVRVSENDRRATPSSTHEKRVYKGPERRSGSERRKWINRIDEMRKKFNE